MSVWCDLITLKAWLWSGRVHHVPDGAWLMTLHVNEGASTVNITIAFQDKSNFQLLIHNQNVWAKQMHITLHNPTLTTYVSLPYTTCKPLPWLTQNVHWSRAEKERLRAWWREVVNFFKEWNVRADKKSMLQYFKGTLTSLWYVAWGQNIVVLIIWLLQHTND